MKKLTVVTFLFFVFLAFSQAQYITKFVQSSERLPSNENVYKVVFQNEEVGQFIPVYSMRLVTKDTDPNFFLVGSNIESILKGFNGGAVVPGNMTDDGSSGKYQMLGKNLSQGRPCGDGNLYQYGIICLNAKGDSIGFTHKNEIPNFDSLYDSYQEAGGSIFFLPSIFRNGNYISSDNVLDKVLIRRDTPAGPQIGVILFNKLITYDQAREIVLGLDRIGKSQTTHIYMLDGGNIWGQSCKKTNGSIKVIGTRNSSVVTNYLVLY